MNGRLDAGQKPCRCSWSDVHVHGLRQERDDAAAFCRAAGSAVLRLGLRATVGHGWSA